MSDTPTRWLQLEAWIEENQPSNFTAVELANDLHISTREASRMIQSYLTAQRGRRSETAFVLKRAGRTKRAVWSVGQTTTDARTLGRVLFDDFLTTMKRAYAPDMDRIREVNPRTARFIVAKMETMDAAVQLLGAALDAEVSEALFAIENERAA
jgi:hypothetical protein